MAPPAVSFLAIAVVLMVTLLQAASTPPPPPSTTAPSSCAFTLSSLYPCTGFLSAGTSLAGPPEECCGSVRTVIVSPENICLCHLIGGAFNEYAHVNIDPFRLALLPLACLVIVPPELPYMCFVGPVPPIYIPVPPVTPPPPSRG
ncbi:unnamed protein product [Urochloa humidicola]